MSPSTRKSSLSRSYLPGPGSGVQGREDFERIGIPESQMSYQPTVEMRYAGQFHEMEVDMPAQTLSAENLQALPQNFHAKYEKMYTYS